jgi:hypothetical protein
MKRRSDIAKLDRRFRRFCHNKHDTYITGRYTSSRGCKLCHKLTSKAWVKSHRIWCNKRNAAWAKKNPLSRKNSQLKHMYNITLLDYQLLALSQDNRCGICNKLKKLSVDHEHQSNKVRGLLCTECNLFIVPVVERFHKIIPKAVKYLEDFNAKA